MCIVFLYFMVLIMKINLEAQTELHSEDRDNYWSETSSKNKTSYKSLSLLKWKCTNILFSLKNCENQNTNKLYFKFEVDI